MKHLALGDKGIYYYNTKQDSFLYIPETDVILILNRTLNISILKRHQGL